MTFDTKVNVMPPAKSRKTWL